MSRPVHVVASPIIFKNKTLLIKRTKDPYKNYWSMVGGKVEIGEEIKKAIIREIEEETGLFAKFVAIRGVVYETLYNGKTAQDHFLIWVCETTIKNNFAVEKNEGEVKWFTKTDLLKNKNQIVPSDYAMIKTFAFSKNPEIKIHTSTMKSKGNKYTLEFFG